MNNLFLAEQLDLGAKITAQRKALGVRAQSTARAAGISRVTLHRIEKGETSVSLGAYLQVCRALGLHMGILTAPAEASIDKLQDTNQLKVDGPHIRIADYPQLKALAWQLDIDALLTDEEAIGIYERNKRFLELNQVSGDEKILMDRLTAEKGMENFFV